MGFITVDEKRWWIVRLHGSLKPRLNLRLRLRHKPKSKSKSKPEPEHELGYSSRSRSGSRSLDTVKGITIGRIGSNVEEEREEGEAEREREREREREEEKRGIEDQSADGASDFVADRPSVPSLALLA